MTFISHLNNLEEFKTLSEKDLTLLKGGGLSHDHMVLGDSGWLLRMPRGNQLGMGAEDYLVLQKACFDQAWPSGHTPRCLGILPPSAALPDGALIVEKIEGRKARVPDDYAAIGEALAHLHKISTPAVAAPLQTASFPFESQQHFLLTTIFGDAAARAPISPKSRRLIENEKSALLSFIEDHKQRGDIPQSLIDGDSHPANFLITDTGKAVLVDLEFANYDVPYVDLADASLPITTRLDPAMTAVTDAGKRSALYESWCAHADPAQAEKLAEFRPWAERMVQMRTLLWLCDWSAQGQKNIQPHIQPRTIENWNAMAAAYLEPDSLARLLQAGITPSLTPNRTPPAAPGFQPS